MKFHDLLDRAVPLAARDAELAERSRDLAARHRELATELDEAKRELRRKSEAFAAGGKGAPTRKTVLAANANVQELEALADGFESAGRQLKAKSDELRPERVDIELGLIITATEMMVERARLRASEDLAWFAAEIMAPIDELDLRGAHGGNLAEAVKNYLPEIGQPPHASDQRAPLRVAIPGGGQARIDTPAGREQLERLGLRQAAEMAS